MKKTKFSILGFSLLLTTGAFAMDPCAKIDALLICGKGNVENNLVHKGALDITGTHITQALNIVGSSVINDAMLNQLNIKGSLNIVNSTIDGTANILGMSVIKSTKFNKDVKIRGINYISNVKFAAPVKISGTIQGEKCIFNNEVEIRGKSKFSHSKFTSPIFLKTQAAIFSGSQLSDVKIAKGKKSEQQVITIADGSSVGNITFVNNNGLIKLSADSKLLGEVKGGKISQQ
jgi:hypothetical protein